MSEIKPALTPEEWRQEIGPLEEWEYLPRTLPVRDGEFFEFFGTGPDKAHAAAAKALHGQPFGFTWDDVDELRWRCRRTKCEEPGRSRCGGCDLADRIASLLPPRQP